MSKSIGTDHSGFRLMWTRCGIKLIYPHKAVGHINRNQLVYIGIGIKLYYEDAHILTGAHIRWNPLYYHGLFGSPQQSSQ